MSCYACTPFGTKSKNVQAFKVITADLLIQQAKVRRNAFITIQVTYTTNFNHVLCGMIITRLAPIECMYYITLRPPLSCLCISGVESINITSISREHVTHALYICYMTMSCIGLSLIKFMLCYVMLYNKDSESSYIYTLHYLSGTLPFFFRFR